MRSNFEPFVDQPIVVSNTLTPLSTLCFFPKIFTIKSRSRQKTNKCIKIGWPPIFGRDDPQLFYSGVLARFRLLSTVLQSLVEFRLLTSACSRPGNEVVQNLQRVGKNSRPILSRL